MKPVAAMESTPPELANYFIVSLTSFLSGVVVGWFAAKRIDNLTDKEMRRLVTLMLIAAYVVSVMSEIFITGYNTPMLLHAIIGGVVGYMFSIEDDGFNINIGGGK